MGEARIIERYCDGNANTVGYGIAKMAGTIHVAIARKQPAAAFNNIQAVVDNLNLKQLTKDLEAAGLAGDAGPPDVSNSDDSEPSPENSNNGSGPAQANGTRVLLVPIFCLLPSESSPETLASLPSTSSTPAPISLRTRASSGP